MISISVHHFGTTAGVIRGLRQISEKCEYCAIHTGLFAQFPLVFPSTWSEILYQYENLPGIQHDVLYFSSYILSGRLNILECTVYVLQCIMYRFYFLFVIFGWVWELAFFMILYLYIMKQRKKQTKFKINFSINLHF